MSQKERGLRDNHLSANPPQLAFLSLLASTEIYTFVWILLKGD